MLMCKYGSRVVTALFKGVCSLAALWRLRGTQASVLHLSPLPLCGCPVSRIDICDMGRLAFGPMIFHDVYSRKNGESGGKARLAG